MSGQPPLPRLTRRDALGGLAITAGATVVGGRAQARPVSGAVAPLLPGAGVCILTPQAVEGPFYFDPALERADITEGGDGVPLELLLQVIEAGDCSPLPGARADVWHANAIGHYSGYQGQGDGRDVSTEGMTFLRGTQFTNGGGAVSFRTIYPGWYAGRAPHIHFKVFVDNRNVVTGQIYFPDALSEFIYTNVPPYTGRSGARDTTNDRDGVLAASGGGRETFASIREDADRYVAALVIGIDREAQAAAGRRPPQGSPPGGGGSPMPGAGRRGSLVPGIGP